MHRNIFDLIHYAYFHKEGDAKFSERISDGKFGLYLTIFLITCVAFNIFSIYIFDVNEILRSYWPWSSSVYKSITNPKFSLVFWAALFSIPLYFLFLPSGERFKETCELYLKGFIVPIKLVLLTSFFGIGVFIPLTSKPDPLPFSTPAFIILIISFHLLANLGYKK